MKGIKKYLAGTALSLGLLFVTAASAPAMEVNQFAHMSMADQSSYAADLVQGSINILNQEGQTDMADRTKQLFDTLDPNNPTTSIGMKAFHENLLTALKIETQNPTKVLHVESAFILTLKHNGIIVPPNFGPSLIQVTKEFKPGAPSTNVLAANEISATAPSAPAGP